MWVRRQVLAEIRTYVADHDDANTDIVSTFITRSCVKDNKYQAFLKTFDEDPESTECEVKENVQPSEDNLNNQQPDTIETSDLTKLNDQLSCVTIDENKFPQVDFNACVEMMESLGLPTGFGPKRGPSRKDQKLSEKQIKSRFLNLWEKHGELMVYKSFVSIYPDYAGYYDQIGGSIPPCEEIEIVCSAPTNKVATIDQNSSDVEYDTSDTEKEDLVPDKTIETDENAVKENKDFLNTNSNNICSKGENSQLVEPMSCCGDAKRKQDFLIQETETQNPIKNCDVAVTNGQSCDKVEDISTNGFNNKLERDTTEIVAEKQSNSNTADHSYSGGDHSYGGGEHSNSTSNISSTKNCSQEDENAEDNADYQYSHAELINILRGTHQDLENQIYWHAKETISEWYRKHPKEDFEVSSLDEDIMAIAQPYMYQAEQGGDQEGGVEEEAGGVVGEKEEDVDDPDGDYDFLNDDFYTPYGEEKDRDLIGEDGVEKHASLTETLEVCGLAIKKDSETSDQRKRKIAHSTVTYKRKNISEEAKRLRLDLEPKSSKRQKPKHTYFDDEGETMASCEQDSEDEDKNDSLLFAPESSYMEKSKSENDLKTKELKPEKKLKPKKQAPLKKSKHTIFSDDDDDDGNNEGVQTMSNKGTSSDSEPEEVAISHKGPRLRRKSTSDLSEEIVPNQKLTKAKSESELSWSVTKKLKEFGWEVLELKETDGVTSVLTRANVKSLKKKKKPKKKLIINEVEVADISLSSEDLTEEIKEQHPALVDPKTSKYWYQRYQLFSRFDHGIKLDTESWYSVTHESIAAHLADRCQGLTVLDGFCGAGGNVIQFAVYGCKVIAVDIDEEKIKLARHNAQIYNVEEHIEFVTGDFMQVASQFADKVDMVFLSPPWGGPDYISQEVYDVETMNASKLLEVCRTITNNIALYAPRNSDVAQLITLAGTDKRVEIEQNFLDHKLKAVTAYYGDLVMGDNQEAGEDN